MGFHPESQYVMFESPMAPSVSLIETVKSYKDGNLWSTTGLFGFGSTSRFRHLVKTSTVK